MSELLGNECDWALAELAELRLGQTASNLLPRLEAHLRSCAACQSARAWDQQFARELISLPLPAAPTRLAEKVHRQHRQRKVQRFVVGLAAAAALGFVAFALWPEPPKPNQAQPTPPAPIQTARLREFAPLVEKPPVVPLSSAQDAWLAVLAEECKGGSQ